MANNYFTKITYKAVSRYLLMKDIFYELGRQGCKVRLKDKFIQIDFKAKDKLIIEHMKEIIEKLLFRYKLQILSYSIKDN